MKIGSVLKYAGLSTKLRAMSGRLLKADDYEALIRLRSVKEVVGYLKGTPSYNSILKDKNEEELHRDELERLLKQTLYLDFYKLHKFVVGEDRHILTIFFIRFEVDILKYLLQLAMAGKQDNDVLSSLPGEFIEHSTLNISRLSRAQSVEEIIKALENTPYSKLISSLYSRGQNPTLFDLETALDIYYFSIFWKNAEKYLEGENKDAVLEYIGKEADILNLLWIYRSKKYYQMPKELMYGFIIPVHFMLSRDMLVSLIDAADASEIVETARNFRYGDVFEKLEDKLFERQMTRLIYTLYVETMRDNPFNIVSALGYIMAREVELENVFSIIEGIRYSLSPEQIRDYLITVHAPGEGWNKKTV